MLATAILDRLLRHCHVISINGPSYRLKDRVALAPNPQPRDVIPRPGPRHQVYADRHIRSYANSTTTDATPPVIRQQYNAIKKQRL